MDKIYQGGKLIDEINYFFVKKNTLTRKNECRSEGPRDRVNLPSDICDLRIILKVQSPNHRLECTLTGRNERKCCINGHGLSRPLKW